MADLSRDEIWDDSSLIDTWNHALQEYKKYHSINAKKDLQQIKKPGITLTKNATDKISSANSGDDPPQNEEVMNHEEEQMDEDTESKTELSIENTRPELDAHAPQSHQSSSSVPPPPPFPSLETKDEALKNLMMSWYYAGYYTGLYEGQQKAAQGPSGAT